MIELPKVTGCELLEGQICWDLQPAPPSRVPEMVLLAMNAIDRVPDKFSRDLIVELIDVCLDERSVHCGTTAALHSAVQLLHEQHHDIDRLRRLQIQARKEIQRLRGLVP